MKPQPTDVLLFMGWMVRQVWAVSPGVFMPAYDLKLKTEKQRFIAFSYIGIELGYRFVAPHIVYKDTMPPGM